MIQVDHDDPDLLRVPRETAAMLSEIASGNALTDDISTRYAPGARESWGY
jgi:hypothetical protein